MAKMYVTEFSDVDEGSPHAGSKVVDQTPVTFTTSTQSAAFGGQTTLVRIHVDGIASILFGANPTATTSNMRLAAGQTEYFAVSPGQKVAAVTNT